MTEQEAFNNAEMKTNTEKPEFLKYKEAQELSLKVKWKTTHCQSGKSCWCRIIEPELELKDDDDNEIYIASSGCVPTIYAEHIVKLHNDSLNNLKS